MKRTLITVVLFLLVVSGIASASELYPGPQYLDFRTVTSYTQPLIASATTLPPVASATIGELFLLVATGAPQLYRREFNGVATWTLLSAASGGGGGTTDHSALTNLEYGLSGHTGFTASQTTIDLAATVTAHVASTTDPHGATPTFTGGLVLGSGSPDVSITALGTGVAQIASYVLIPAMTATPPEAIGTLWTDSNASPAVLRFYDGAAWQTFP